MAPVRNETGKGNLEAVENCHLTKSPKILFNNDTVRQQETRAGCDGPCVVPVLSLFRLVDEAKIFVLKAIPSFW